MPGPPPKDPATRQRRNREPSARQLVDTDPLPLGEIPKLPAKRGPDARKKPKWLEATRQLWKTIWTGPLAPAFCRTDLHRLVLYVSLFDEYLRTFDLELLKEMRLQGQALGLTPIDRRRLGWTIEKQFDDVGRPQRPTPARRGRDPRAILTVVK